jgi:hypothetical protein
MAVHEPGWEDRCARDGATPAPWEVYVRDIRRTPDLPAVADWAAVRLCDQCWGEYQEWFNAAPDRKRASSN